MSNFFNSVLKLGEHSVTQPFRAVKETAQGHPDKAFKQFFSDADRRSQDVAHSVGIRGWVGEHPMQTVGAAVATIFGGWAAWGAYGAGAAGGAAGTAGGSTGGLAGTSAMAYTPTASTALGGAGSAGTGSALSYGGSMAGNAIAATGSTWGVGAGGTVGLSGAATTGGISGAGVGASSMAFSAPEAGSAMAYMPTQSTVLGGTGSGGYTGGMSWQQYAQQGMRINNAVNQNNQQQEQKDKQQKQLPPQSVDLLHQLMGNSLNKIQTSDSGQMQPQSTTNIIGGNNQNYNGSSFSNQF